MALKMTPENWEQERRLRERRFREARLKSMVASAMLGGGADAAMTRVLDQLEDLDDAITFFAQWKRGNLLGLEPGQRADRWGATLRFNQLLDREPELYAEMRRQPRYLAALMTQEAMALPIMSFLSRVKEVRFVEEQPGLHWLLLAACHHGCEALVDPVTEPSDGSCAVCGRPQGAATGCASPDVQATTLERIHAVDDYLERSASTDSAAHERLTKDPTEAFAQASLTLFGARPEELFGIHEVKLALDSESMIYFIRLADHEPNRTSLSSRAAEPRVFLG
jgi:hypothetical protein